MMGTIALLNLTVCIWIVLGALVAYGYMRRSLYSDRFLRYCLVCTGVLAVLATLLRYVRMEE